MDVQGPLQRGIPIMGGDFVAAASRHFEDGSLLHRHGRLDNADQLYGLAAECGIKLALAQLPNLSRNGSLGKGLRVHVNDLWERAKLSSLQRRYRALLQVLTGLRNPFADWSIDQRYGPDNIVSRAALEKHREAAVRVLRSVGVTGTRREA